MTALPNGEQPHQSAVPVDEGTILSLIEGFEHEFDVATEKLEITKPVFDGRLGNPAMVLKRSLARYIKHHVVKLISARDAEVAREATIKAVTHIMSAKTEGLFDGPDLFIKRAPIEQAMVDLVGFETFKAIQDAIPKVTLTNQKEDK